MTMPPLSPPPDGEAPRHPFIALRNRILTGLLLTIPLAVTAWVVVALYRLATAWAYDWIVAQPFSELFKEDGHFPFWFSALVRLAGLALVLLFFLAVGELARYALFRRGLAGFERWLDRVPLVKTIYMTCRQIIDAFTKSGGSMFDKVVLFEFPRKGVWAMGFVTNASPRERGFGPLLGEELYSVFYPTTPNPTSGFLLFVPKRDCIEVQISVTDAMRLIISGGAISPESLLRDPEDDSKNR